MLHARSCSNPLDSITARGLGGLTLFDPITVLPALDVCAADLTGDGALNFFDISAFLSAFAAGYP